MSLVQAERGVRHVDVERRAVHEQSMWTSLIDPVADRQCCYSERGLLLGPLVCADIGQGADWAALALNVVRDFGQWLDAVDRLGGRFGQ